MKKVRGSQAFISINSYTKFSKTLLFHVSIVNQFCCIILWAEMKGDEEKVIVLTYLSYFIERNVCIKLFLTNGPKTSLLRKSPYSVRIKENTSQK